MRAEPKPTLAEMPELGIFARVGLGSALSFLEHVSARWPRNAFNTNFKSKNSLEPTITCRSGAVFSF
ncbi:hypothetical protein AYR61_01090 [Secundilactobacillus paracollinoides]|uniref:Uncharacterized protein n=1 Tax=Secundilactobacillus paracollinoides TaxID=240427 RepID=A0A1B2IV17_9LACO|nr:hypothetical protein AYR61_01090 [Secundilactobacillus paracollinoides]ANZ65871.1 hypothetical protein AYR63_01105 [Secundilactobacillus paracollinoides]